MDRVEIGDRVRAAAMDAGILPNDAMGPLVDALADLPGEVESRVAPLLAEMKAIRAAPAVLTDKQVEDISKRLARGCGAWAADMVRTANRHHYVVILGTFLAAAAAGALASWLVFGKPTHPICALTPAGGKICGEWTIPEPKR